MNSLLGRVKKPRETEEKNEGNLYYQLFNQETFKLLVTETMNIIILYFIFFSRDGCYAYRRVE